MPEQWRGVRDAELSQVSGVEGGVFVHAAGFIGGEFVVLSPFLGAGEGREGGSADLLSRSLQLGANR